MAAGGGSGDGNVGPVTFDDVTHTGTTGDVIELSPVDGRQFLDGYTFVTGSSAADYVVLEGRTGQVAILSAVETVVGTSGNDSISVDSPASPLINMLGGADFLDLSDGATNPSVYNVETVFGTNGQDALTVFAGGGATASTLQVHGVETVTAGSGDLYLSVFGSDGATMTTSGVETVVGSGTGNDTVAVGGVTSGIVNLLGGDDSVTLGDTDNTFFVYNVETLTGGAATDDVVLRGAAGQTVQAGGIESITGAASENWVSLADSGGASLVATDVDTLVGTAGADSVTVEASSGIVNLLGGGDTLELAARDNTISAYNVETITGSASTDRVALGGASGQTVQASQVESLAGTAQDDSLTIASGSTMTIAGSSGADGIALQNGQGTDTVLYASQLDGGSFGATTGGDTVTNFQSGTDTLGIDGSGVIAAAVESDGASGVTVASAAQGGVDLSSDEVAVLTQAVAGGGLADTGFASLQAALGTVSGSGRALLLANDGTDSALYYLNDFGGGSIGSQNIRLLGLFQNAVLQPNDIGTT